MYGGVRRKPNNRAGPTQATVVQSHVRVGSMSGAASADIAGTREKRRGGRGVGGFDRLNDDGGLMGGFLC